MRVCSCDSLVLVVLVVCAHGAEPRHLSCRHPFLQNYPLYIRSAPTENELKFHYMVHTSLDVVDEKISAMGKALVDQRELYLGLLYPTEDYKVYPSHLAGAGPVGRLPAGLRLRRSRLRLPGVTVGSGDLERHLGISLGKEARALNQQGSRAA